MSQRFYRTFGLRQWALLIAPFVLGIVLNSAEILGSAWGDWPTLWYELQRLSLVAAPVILGVVSIAALLLYLTGVTVDEYGIRATTLFLWPKKVSWASITNVKLVADQGASYIALRSSETRFSLYLPFRLNDDERFYTLIRQYTRQDNPFRVVFASTTEKAV